MVNISNYTKDAFGVPISIPNYSHVNFFYQNKIIMRVINKKAKKIDINPNIGEEVEFHFNSFKNDVYKVVSIKKKYYGDRIIIDATVKKVGE